MKYLQLDENNNPVKELSDGNIEWDADHFCAAEALSEDERALFKVVEILETAAPEYDGKVSKLEAAGFELNQDSKWVRKFSIIPLTAEELKKYQEEKKKFDQEQVEVKSSLGFSDYDLFTIELVYNNSDAIDRKTSFIREIIDCRIVGYEQGVDIGGDGQLIDGYRFIAREVI
jgi:hypothetical protein